MNDTTEIDWVQLKPAKWIAGTAMIGRDAEFVFWRLCLMAYDNGTPDIENKETMLAVFCKMDKETYREALKELEEAEKIIHTDDGIHIPSVQKRLSDSRAKIEEKRERTKAAREARWGNQKKGKTKTKKATKAKAEAGSSVTEAKEKKTVQKNTEQNNIVLPPIIPLDLWDQFKENRKDKKDPLTPLAESRAVAKLERLDREGYDVQRIIQETVDNQWKGFFEKPWHKFGYDGPTKKSNAANTMKHFEGMDDDDINY